MMAFNQNNEIYQAFSLSLRKQNESEGKFICQCFIVEYNSGPARIKGNKKWGRGQRRSKYNMCCWSGHSFKEKHRHLLSLLGWLWRIIKNFFFFFFGTICNGDGWRGIYVLDPSFPGCVCSQHMQYVAMLYPWFKKERTMEHSKA